MQPTLLFPAQFRRQPWLLIPLGAAALLSLAPVRPVFPQEKPAIFPAPSPAMILPRVLTVTGQGTETIPTTLTQVRLGVEVQAKTAEAAQAEAARRSQSVVEFLRSRQVDKLETTGISLNPTYRYDNNQQTITGYQATNSVSFRLPTDKAGNLLDAAVKAGATRIEGVNFLATDDAIAAARNQALKKATQDAQQQAEAVLSSLQMKSKEIIGIQINGANPAPPVPMPMLARSAMTMEAKVATPIVGSEQRVEANVTLQISY